MSLGWCVSHRADVPSLPDRPLCADCGGVLIPPSWSSRQAPFPWPPRPEGWHWEQPTDDTPRTSARRKQTPIAAPPPPAMIDMVCAHCTRTVQVAPRGGSPQRYCSTVCKHKATAEMTAARKRAARAARTLAPPMVACAHCGAVVPSRPNGVARRFCTDAHRRAWHRAKNEAAA